MHELIYLYRVEIAAVFPAHSDYITSNHINTALSPLLAFLHWTNDSPLDSFDPSSLLTSAPVHLYYLPLT